MPTSLENSSLEVLVKDLYKKNKKMFITEFEGEEQVPACNNELALMKFVFLSPWS